MIDLGMGNPDLPTAPHIVAKLAEAAGNPRAHGYSASRGIPGLRKAQAAYYARRFGVELDPESEVIVTLGSKEGLANLAQAITSPGDIVLVPNPSYPIHPYGFIIAGGSVRHIPVPGSTSLDGVPAGARARGTPHGAQADRSGAELSVESDGAGRRPRFLCRDRRFLQTPGHLDPVATSPMPRSISTASRRRRCCRCRARATSPSSSPR